MKVTNNNSVNRKGLFLLLLGLSSFFTIGNVSAQELSKAEKTDMLINQYKIDEDFVNSLDSKTIDEITDEDTEYLGFVRKYFKTTYLTDPNGNVFTTDDEEITKEEALEIAENSKTNSVANGDKTWVSETVSKTVSLQYYKTNSWTKADLSVVWNTVPKVKSYDVLALRFASPVTFQTVTGYQMTNIGTQNYSYNGTNMKKFSNGVGLSMNLMDDATSFSCSLHATINNTNNVIPVYGTYQHAKTDVTLATSQSYTLSSSGLGGVLAFNTNTIKNYYDGMGGVYLLNYRV